MMGSHHSLAPFPHGPARSLALQQLLTPLRVPLDPSETVMTSALRDRPADLTGAGRSSLRSGGPLDPALSSLGMGAGGASSDSGEVLTRLAALAQRLMSSDGARQADHDARLGSRSPRLPPAAADDQRPASGEAASSGPSIIARVWSSRSPSVRRGRTPSVGRSRRTQL